MFDRLIRLSPVILFIAYAIKLLIFSASYVDAGILGVIAALYFGCVYKFDEKKFLDIANQIEKLNESFKKQEQEHARDVQEIKTFINAARMSNQFKQMQPK